MDNFNNTSQAEFFAKLGLNAEEIIVFTTLLQKGILTVLRISKETNINRTRVYRLLEDLKSKGFVEEIIDQHHKFIKAVGPDRLDAVIREEETKAKYLRKLLPVISSGFANYQSMAQPGTKVLFYRGKEGIKQQVWNILKAKGEMLGYSYRPLTEIIGDFSFKWREEWTRRNKSMRDIYSDEYLESRKSSNNDSLEENTKSIISRYIPSSILNINHQIDIYNDVVSHYNWFEEDVFGVEIYNAKIASLERQFFEIVWKMAKMLKSPL